MRQPNRQAQHRLWRQRYLLDTASCQRQGQNAALPEWINALKLRSAPEGSSRRHQQCLIRVLGDRRIFIFIDGENGLRYMSANHVLDLPGRSPPPGTVQVSASGWRYRHSVRAPSIFRFPPPDEQANSAPIALQSCSASAMFSLLPIPRPTLTTRRALSRLTLLLWRAWVAVRVIAAATAWSLPLHGVRFASA